MTDRKAENRKGRTKPVRGHSIARRLHAALVRRWLCRAVLWDLLLAVLVLFLWGYGQERDSAAYLGLYEPGGTVQRSITAGADAGWSGYRAERFMIALENRISSRLAEHIALETPLPWTEPLPLAGIFYRVSVMHGGTERVLLADASGILTLVLLGLCVLLPGQLLLALLRLLFGGGRFIRKYLRPIDDLAQMAEQLSSRSAEPVEKCTFPAAGVPDPGRKAVDKSDVSITEKTAAEKTEKPAVGKEAVRDAIDAIEAVDSSRARISVRTPELHGLEAAVNNMLKRLEEAQKQQIRFVDDASHELRTPIAVIQGYADLLARWGGEDPQVQEEAVQAIRSEAAHMKTLLDQLLFLARGEMDRHVLELKPVSAEQLLLEVQEEYRMLDPVHIYELHLPAEDCLWQMQADETMMKQCLRILCDNAKKYTPAGGTITLGLRSRVRADGKDGKGQVRKQLCLEVQDTGQGIPAAELPRIFDRFYRGERARTDSTGGSGLGLSIARWIAERHHGCIEAVSSPGLGTKMTVLLPVPEGGEGMERA